MKKTPHSLKLGFLAVILLFCSFISCSSTEGIDNYFTFNTEKQYLFSVDAQAAVGADNLFVGLLPPDSMDFAKNGTTHALVNSAKLTKLEFKAPNPSYTINDLDSVRILVTADSLPDLLLATYSKSENSIILTNADFAAYIKKPVSYFKIIFRPNKVPPIDFEVILFNYTLVFSAKPQE